MARSYTSIEPIVKDEVKGIHLSATLDSRYQSEKMPIAVRVAYDKRTYYLPTGIKVTFEAYEKVRNARGGAGDFISIRRETKSYYDKVLKKTKELTEEDRFSFLILKEELGYSSSGEMKTLQEYWRAIADEKDKRKTQEQYTTSMRSFFKSIGCKVTFTDASADKPEYTKTRAFTITGHRSNMVPKEVTPAMIKNWEQLMIDNGLSTSTRSVYMRAFRALFNKLKEDGVISSVPKIKITEGDRRTEDYLRVSDIIRIRDYQGEAKEAADWWIILYLCNGCNMVDLAQLKWNSDYFKSNELSFVRSKTRDKKPVKVYIPVTDLLKPYLQRYGSEPYSGRFVFPQILKPEHGKLATTTTEITNATQRFNAMIREGMQTVCQELELDREEAGKSVTASTARNSYITTLTSHDVADQFIDRMVGHAVGNNVLRGYQGGPTPKKRASVNNLLFTDPDER